MFEMNNEHPWAGQVPTYVRTASYSATYLGLHAPDRYRPVSPMHMYIAIDLEIERPAGA